MKRFYLEESHPGEFVVALQWVPEVVLQSPELSVQIVVNWDGTGKKVNGCKWIKYVLKYIYIF